MIRHARRSTPKDEQRRRGRRGAAALDNILVLGIILPLAAVVMPMGRRIIQLVYEMTVVLVAWPFL